MVPEKSDKPWTEKEMAAIGLLPETINELIKVYNTEDIDTIYDMTKEQILEAENGAEIFEALLNKRNINWVKQIPTIAKKSPTFFAVGAAHLSGPNGVINLLHKAGLTVEPVEL